MGEDSKVVFRWGQEKEAFLHARQDLAHHAFVTGHQPSGSPLAGRASP